jgi:hypothetical protein
MMAGNSRLLVTPEAGDITEFMVSPSARISRDGKSTSLDGIQPRDNVVVMYSGNGEDRVASDVVAHSPF